VKWLKNVRLVSPARSDRSAAAVESLGADVRRGDLDDLDGLIALARATGVAGYLGDGNNRWPSADTRDVGRLYRLAIESAPAGSRLHAVA